LTVWVVLGLAIAAAVAVLETSPTPGRLEEPEGDRTLIRRRHGGR
jgi:hypothetical protein